MRNITIVGLDHYFGAEVFRIDQEIWLRKDIENEFDAEAIKVELEKGITLGYVANSVFTVAKGTRSAGRIYDTMIDKQRAKVLFIVNNVVIAQLLDEEV